MRIVLLDGEKIESCAMLHETFQRELELPEYYGANFDALYDVLTERREEIGVIIANEAALREHLGRRWKAFLRLMHDLAENREAFHFCDDPFGEAKAEDQAKG